MDMQIARLMKIAIDAEHAGARAGVAERRAGRLLHHVAECTCETELAAAADDADFDLQHFTADARVREAGCYADLRLECEQRRIMRRRSEKRLQIIRTNSRFFDNGLRDSGARGHAVARLGTPARQLSRYASQPALELAHTRFARVALRDCRDDV